MNSSGGSERFTGFRSFNRRLEDGVDIAEAGCGDFVFPPHVHEGLTLGVVTGGREIIECRGADAPLARGDVYLIPPDTIHGGRSYERGSWRYISLYIAPDMLTSLCANESWRHMFSSDLVLDIPYKNKIAKLLVDLATLKPRLQIGSALAEITLVLQNLNFLCVDQHSSAASGSRSPVCMVRDYVDAHYSQDISLSDLAVLSGWSAPHLIEAFKKKIGSTPYAYLLARRLREAEKRLLKGGAVSAVATECGFYDQSHLNRYFVRAFGQPPAAYARSLAR